MRVKTFGSLAARSASASTTQSANRRRGFFWDPHDAESRACSCPGEPQFHRSHADVAPAGIGGAVDYDRMPATRLGDEAHVFNPLNSRFDGMGRFDCLFGGLVLTYSMWMI